MKVTHLLMAAAVAVLMAAPVRADESAAVPAAAPAATAPASAPAAAPSDKKAMGHHHHHMMPKGGITKDEWMKHASEKFDRLDANHDGKITEDEFKAGHEHKHCPPGLAKKHNGCLPPGQAKKGSGDGSTSMPPANNEKSDDTKPGGADGAGGWTAQ